MSSPVPGRGTGWLEHRQEKRHVQAKSSAPDPAARSAPSEVIVLDGGKRLTGRLLHNAFVWTEEVLSEEEWLAAVAAAGQDPDITVVIREDKAVPQGRSRPNRRH